jgi:biopolymer transport protein ExbD
VVSPVGNRLPRDETDPVPGEAVIEHTRVRQRHGRGRSRIGLNLTAMIDVVFLLLVYFMAATEFKLGEEIYRLDLPQRGASADPFDLPRDPLRVAVASTGPRAGPASYVIRIPGAHTQPQTFEELYEFLHQSRRSRAAVGGLFEPDHPIVIEPAGTTRWEHAMEAFNAAARARYTNVTFAGPG